MIIADTCLVFHLFNETLLTSSAQEVLSIDSYWVLPPLWREEYANVLSKLARKEGKPSTEVIEHFNQTVETLANSEIGADTQKALKLSIDYKISVYDAHFVSLAIDLNTLLVTEDKEILKKCPKFSVSVQDFKDMKKGS